MIRSLIFIFLVVIATSLCWADDNSNSAYFPSPKFEYSPIAARTIPVNQTKVHINYNTISNTVISNMSASNANQAYKMMQKASQPMPKPNINYSIVSRTPSQFSTPSLSQQMSLKNQLQKFNQPTATTTKNNYSKQLKPSNTEPAQIFSGKTANEIKIDYEKFK